MKIIIFQMRTLPACIFLVLLAVPQVYPVGRTKAPAGGVVRRRKLAILPILVFDLGEVKLYIML